MYEVHLRRGGVLLVQQGRAVEAYKEWLSGLLPSVRGAEFAGYEATSSDDSTDQSVATFTSRRFLLAFEAIDYMVPCAQAPM